MTDIGEAAPAPAAGEDVVSTPNPINVDNVDHSKPSDTPAEPARRPSASEAVARAAAKIEADEKGETDKPRPVDAKGAERDETGKFKGKAADKPAEPKAGEPDKAAAPEKAAEQAKPGEQQQAQQQVARKPHDDPPPRLKGDAAATADWVKAPESVRAATHRIVRELEDGIAEHQRYREPLKPFEELARQNSTDIPSALKRYVAFDVMLSQDPIKGLASIAEDKGLNLRAIAAHILGQPAPTQNQQDQTVAELRREIGALKQQISGIGGHVQSQQQKVIHGDVEAFASQPGHEDFEALSGLIAAAIQNDPSATLEQAYEQAKTYAQEFAVKLGFTPGAAPAQTRTDPDPIAEAQTLDKGLKSITGGPGTGSEPAKRKPSSSISDAVSRAMSSVG